MKLTVKAKDGKDAGEHEVAFDVLENAKGTQAVHEVVTAYRAAQRSGTAKTKDRSEVAGTGKKPWRQKGTGRSRIGSIRNPSRVHGSKAFGPKPHGYQKKVNKKVKQLARKSILSQKVSDKNFANSMGHAAFLKFIFLSFSNNFILSSSLSN